jgi:catechol 2,3-dioxygenase-like lactoylglutathione lyase family enzyme
MTRVQSKPNITRVSTVAVPVSDQDRAVEFYVGKLGFEKRMDAPISGSDRWIEVGPSDASTTIALVPPGDAFSPGTDTGIRLTTTSADADHAALQAAGVDVDPEVLRWGGGVPPMFSLRDPDGNRLYIVEQPDLSQG